MKLESSQSAEEKQKWKVIRKDTCDDVPGEIVSADEATGACEMKIAGEVQKFDFSRCGIMIVERGRFG